MQQGQRFSALRRPDTASKASIQVWLSLSGASFLTWAREHLPSLPIHLGMRLPGIGIKARIVGLSGDSFLDKRESKGLLG